MILAFSLLDVETFDPSFLRAFTTVALVVFVVLCTLADARMVWRLSIFLITKTKVPTLLKRDIVMFGTFTFYFGLVLIVRILGLSVTQDPRWVIPTTVPVLFAVAYWVWVEFHLD